MENVKRAMKMTQKAMESLSQKNTVLDYLAWRGDLTLAQDPFNEVDALLLCIFSYIDYRRIQQLCSWNIRDALPIGEVCDRLTEQDEQLGLSQMAYIPVMRLAATTRRFAGVRMFAFENELNEQQELQFAAMGYLLPDGTVFAAYRGTDTSFVGWKEDFNLSFLESVPAQQYATAYAECMALLCPDRPLRIGGHSKGGNLAAWAAMRLAEDLQPRLLAAYNNDGPGFSEDMGQDAGYQQVRHKLHTFVPASSIVGVLLHHEQSYAVVDSTNRGIWQHEPLSWCVTGGRFTRVEKRSAVGQLSDEVLQDWLANMDNETRRGLTEAIFEVISQKGKLKSLDELQEGPAGAIALLKAYNAAGEEQRHTIAMTMENLAREVRADLRAAAWKQLKKMLGLTEKSER